VTDIFWDVRIGIFIAASDMNASRVDIRTRKACCLQQMVARLEQPEVRDHVCKQPSTFDHLRRVQQATTMYCGDCSEAGSHRKRLEVGWIFLHNVLELGIQVDDLDR